MIAIVPLANVTLGIVAGTYVQGEGLSVLARLAHQKKISAGPLTLPLLVGATVGIGYLLGGDRPGTFGRGVMYGAFVLPALVTLYYGGVALTGRT